MVKLSIVIPCYNCQQTLAEAVDSVYRQNAAIPFDLTMVDDGSTDATYEVMESLSARFPEITLVRHQVNQGGGAARNTGVASSDGDIVFCLDSDDVLGPDFIENMTQFWMKKRCEAVGVTKSVKFKRSNLNDVAYTTEFAAPGQQVTFESLLDASLCSLLSTFLMTREAFAHVGGYPTQHGFDTQGMAWRFLCNGLTAYTCPNATYYHRVNYHQSYYLREQSAGRINWNWFSVFDENLYVFADHVKAKILQSDLFPIPARSQAPDLLTLVQGQDPIYAPNYRELIVLGRDAVAARFESTDDGFTQYWLGSYHSSKGQYREALLHFGRALELGFGYRIIHYRMLLASLRLSGRNIAVEDGLEELALYCRPYPVERLPFRKRIVLRARLNPLLGGPTRILAWIWDGIRGLRTSNRSSGKVSPAAMSIPAVDREVGHQDGRSDAC